jgi:chromosome segregation and condensation protein ScpB
VLALLVGAEPLSIQPLSSIMSYRTDMGVNKRVSELMNTAKKKDTSECWSIN